MTLSHPAASALAGLLLLAATPAFAEQRPYDPLIVTYDATGADDADLKALIASLQKAVDNADVATLKNAIAPDLLIFAPPIGFPDETPAGPLANPDKHPGVQRLDEAAILTTSSDMEYSREDLDGLIIDLFGTALEPKTIGKSKTAGGALCSPAEPIFDRDKALAIASAADVPPGNLWILSEKTDFHEKPDLKSAVVGTLPANSIVPFIEGSVDSGMAQSDEGEDSDEAEDWYSVALPSGKIGYAANDASLAFQSLSVCYGKADGKWAVTAVVVPAL
jgi:hypothetical protein